MRAVDGHAPREPVALRDRLTVQWLAPLITFGLVALAWQLVASHQRNILPSLGAVFAELGDHPRLYLSNAGITLEQVAVGAAASFTVALLFAIAMVHIDLLERAVMPLAVVVNVTPVIAIAPALVIAFGYGVAPKYLLTAIITFFPFLVNALVGLRSVDRGVLELAQTLHASRREILWHLRLPSSLPFLFAAARVCLPLAVVGAVIAEFVVPGTQGGLGAVISVAQSYIELPSVYAAIVCLAVIGVALTLLVVALERRLLSWHPSQLTDAR